jgi:hypothetical protein
LNHLLSSVAGIIKHKNATAPEALVHVLRLEPDLSVVHTADEIVVRSAEQ